MHLRGRSCTFCPGCHATREFLRSARFASRAMPCASFLLARDAKHGVCLEGHALCEFLLARDAKRGVCLEGHALCEFFARTRCEAWGLPRGQCYARVFARTRWEARGLPRAASHARKMQYVLKKKINIIVKRYYTSNSKK